jgi:hypothetical protein
VGSSSEFAQIASLQIMTRGIDDHDIDEALWSAYRCCDKSAVTENLLRRYLPDLSCIANVSATRDAVRESGRPKFLKNRFSVQMMHVERRMTKE